MCQELTGERFRPLKSWSGDRMVTSMGTPGEGGMTAVVPELVSGDGTGDGVVSWAVVAGIVEEDA